jgi:TonB family protein
MREIKHIKIWVLIVSFIMISSGIYGQGKFKKVKASDNHADFDGYEYYLGDSLICSSKYDSISKRDIFLLVNEQPAYGDSISDILEYVKMNLKYPNTQADVVGVVFVQFIVEIDGALTNFKILRGLESSFDKEAIEVLKNMPSWTPGRCNGEKVPVYFTIPVKFELY